VQRAIFTSKNKTITELPTLSIEQQHLTYVIEKTFVDFHCQPLGTYIINKKISNDIGLLRSVERFLYNMCAMIFDDVLLKVRRKGVTMFVTLILFLVAC